VAKYKHNFRAGYRAGKLHAPQHVIVYDISRHPADECVTDTDIEYDFGGHSGIETSKYHGRRVLPSRARSLLA
jgi:hypothetical protein